MTASLVIPPRHISLVDEAESERAPAPEKVDQQALAGMSILLVEDQSLIALDTEDLLRRLGARDVRLSPDPKHALRLLESYRPDAAILDFNLGDETSSAVADHLLAKGVPFVFATGYGDSVMIPEHMRSVPVVRKPASMKSVAARLAEARALLART